MRRSIFSPILDPGKPGHREARQFAHSTKIGGGRARKSAQAVPEVTFSTTGMSCFYLEGVRGHLAKVGKGPKAQQIKEVKRQN